MFNQVNSRRLVIALVCLQFITTGALVTVSCIAARKPPVIVELEIIPEAKRDKSEQVLTIPEGKYLLKESFYPTEAIGGFVVSGSEVDVLVEIRDGEKRVTIPLLMNMTVLKVEKVMSRPGDIIQFFISVSFAMDQKQALSVQLAQARGFKLTIRLRNPDDKSNEGDVGYDLDRIIERLKTE